MDAYTAFLLRNLYDAHSDRYNQDFGLPQTNGADSCQLPLGDYCAVEILSVESGNGTWASPYVYNITDLNGLYGSYSATVNPQLHNPVKLYGPFTAGVAVVWNVITGYIESPELDATSTAFEVILSQTGGSAGSWTANCTWTYSVYDARGKLLAAGATPVNTRLGNVQYQAGTVGVGWYNASNVFQFATFDEIPNPIGLTFSVALTTDGGAGGTPGTSNCTFTYTVKDSAGKTLLTTATPQNGRLANVKYTAATKGIGWISGGSVVFAALNELPATTRAALCIGVTWDGTTLKYQSSTYTVFDSAVADADTTIDTPTACS